MLTLNQLVGCTMSVKVVFIVSVVVVMSLVYFPFERDVFRVLDFIANE